MWFAVLIICQGGGVCMDMTIDEPMRSQAECLIRAQPLVAAYVGAHEISLAGKEWAIGCKLGKAGA